MKDKFELVGLDLALFGSKPLLFAMKYNSCIIKFNNFIRTNLKRLIANPGSSYDRLLQIRQVGINKFFYDAHIKVNHIICKINTTDPELVYKQFDITNNIIKFYCSTVDSIMFIVWNHGLIDGVSLYKIIYSIFDKPYNINAIQKSTIFTLNYSLLTTAMKILNFVNISQLNQDIKPVFDSFVLSISTIKRLSIVNNVSFASQTIYMYLKIIFKNVPNHITRLRVNITCHIINDELFNNFSIIPITVYRDNLYPAYVQQQCDYGKCVVYTFQEISKQTSRINILKKMDWLDPDINISLMKGDCEMDEHSINSINVYSFASKAKIYSCGNKCSDNYIISNSITTSEYRSVIHT
jgi:hypothetical protein